MLNKRKVKLIPLLGFLLLSFTFSSNAAASDLDIFNVVTEDLTPNVLLIMDISGSMGFNDVWDSSRNRYFTRLAIAKEVVTEIIKENPNVKWGLFTFPNKTGWEQSGQLAAPCMLRTGVQLNAFINQLNQLDVYGGTPVSSALAEAGLYFAGQRSFFWNTQYTSPIENECQYNNIILMTDGFSSMDSGVRGGFTTTGSAKYNMATNNTIFLKPYMYGKIIGDYITRRTFAADPAERLDLGARLNRPEFIKSSLWTKIDNPDEVNGNLSVYSVGYTSINWARVESGSPTLGDTNIRVNGQLLAARASQLIATRTPYISGYNASDPSRPFPALTFTASGSNTLLNLAQQGFLQGTQIYQGNHTGAGNYASDYLDDVAAFLNNEDLRPDMGIGTKYEKQVVKVFTVGFMFSSDLLERTSVMGGAGPRGQGYFTAEDFEELKMAFSTIIRSIKEDMAVFAAPSLPASGDNEAYSSDYLYMGMFKPQEGFWIGNLKRYTLDENHSMDSYKNADGVISSSAKSDWRVGNPDGNDITQGGVADSLNPVLTSMVGVSNTKDLRRIYTYLKDGANNDLTHTNNLFLETNSGLTAGILGLENSMLVKNAITSIRLTPMGAVMHSVPAVVQYPTQKVVYVGANDGFLHAFFDNDTAAPEAWAFVMPEHLPTIAKARTSTPSDGVYYVDGYISTAKVDDKIVLITGARRGGETYVALDVTNYNAPKFLFQAPNFKQPGGAAHIQWRNYTMGQSWGMPRFVNVHASVTSSGNYSGADGDIVRIEDVTFEPYSSIKDGAFILLPGGYDTKYDTLAAEDISSGKGALVVGVNAISGVPANQLEQLNSTTTASMRHSVLDLLPLDLNSDSLVDAIYYGDLGGTMFYAWPYSQSTETIGVGGAAEVYYKYTGQSQFVPYIFFKTQADSGRKFMFAPDMMLKDSVEYVFFGSGDREDPLGLSRSVQDRFYCVKNMNKSRLALNVADKNFIADYNVASPTSDGSDLMDVTQNLIQSADVDDITKNNIKDALQAGLGWYIDLLEGEKVVGSPLAYRDYVMFTTYQPLYDELPDPSDICVGGSSRGAARLYILNYLDGSAAKDRNGDNTTDTMDRATIIGDTIPSAPVLTTYSSVDDAGVNTITAYVTVLVGKSSDMSGGGAGTSGEVTISNEHKSGTNSHTEKVDERDEDPGTPQPQGGVGVFYWREIY